MFLRNVDDTGGYLVKLNVNFSISKTDPEEFTRMICDAIDAGYRHIDGAMFYENEDQVGNGLKKKMDEKVVEREELFVVSKVLYMKLVY